MDPVAIATWGLVVATGLLVLASIIPVFNGFQDRRRAREVLAAQVIPNMHLLKSRLIGAKDRILSDGQDEYNQIKDFDASSSTVFIEFSNHGSLISLRIGVPSKTPAFN